ncbi:hypothetical protein C1645_829985 [Glomus cerebriforme]|uniref:Uncharacterized protein n=1 Tax=Glomus cerebriforme TaxID=658196 RepID=A0A397SPW4_9GLOM|nr:hypothetical protein C1645_829985 [Glomus cerebriforme]
MYIKILNKIYIFDEVNFSLIDTKQDAWFSALAFEAVFETMENRPKWIRYNVEIHSWLFLKPREAKTIIDLHHTTVKAENDIVEAAKGLSETLLANIESDCDNNFVKEMEISKPKKQLTKKAKIKTIKGISKTYYWKWPVENTQIPQLTWTIPIDAKSDENDNEYVEIGELKEEDIPKVHTIQNWLSSYTHAFKQKATEYESETELLRNP